MKDTCFKLHGYPEWWEELQKKKKAEKGAGKESALAALVSGGTGFSLVSDQKPMRKLKVIQVVFFLSLTWIRMLDGLLILGRPIT